MEHSFPQKSTTRGKSRDKLMARAERAEAEVDMALALVNPLAHEWLDLLVALRARGWKSHPSERGSTVDLPMIETYRRLFDKLANLAEMCDPFAAHSSEPPMRATGHD